MVLVPSSSSVCLLRRRLFSSLATAAASHHVRSHSHPLTFSDTWAPATVSHLSPATADKTLFHLTLNLSSHPSLPARHLSPGQFLPLRIPSTSSPPLLLSIASPPHLAQLHSHFDLLVKRVTGSLSDTLCGMREGDLVEVGEVMGKGFQIPDVHAHEDVALLLMFATGSGISPIRSLIESGFNQDKKAQVHLYYGARNLDRMAYQDRFKYWESSGVKVIPVLSRPDETWSGARGYVQTTFLRDKQIPRPSSTGAVLCGHRQMTEEITSILLAEGVSKEKILTNF
ncbi:FAD/NAD(P)-binding oxidoreductase [Rhynchospora pubera]|uniref:FAD/NAD(P)-binding oxidoreductase n=1 Tax=Rhynchospora pubera TaxID=906938 RepID=A0AAV8FRS7_9POAL|nr:FAD/NAD(P)-binding oxidoreductase [Rhynchospora pubera]